MSKKFNVKPTDAKYIVKEDIQTVICIIDETRFAFIDFANANFDLTNYDLGIDIAEKLEMPNRFTGIATCSKNDEWNVETGKLIAFSRAKDKLNKSFFKRANLYVNTLDKYANKAANVLNELGEKLSINTDHRHNYIESLIGKDDSKK